MCYSLSHYIKVEKGVTLFVEDLGKGTPVVCIHGWPINQKMYEYQMNHLIVNGYRYIGIDLRGFGKSDHPLEGYTYDRMADDIRVVINKLKLKNITLVGFSMGGAICIRYMSKHKGYKVSKCILAGAAAPSYTKRQNYPYGATKEETTLLIQNILNDRPKTIEEFGMKFFYSPISDSFRRWFNGLGLEASSHGTAYSAMSLRDEDVRKDLEKVLAPTAIFHGVQDQICPFDFAVQMNKGIKDSKLIRFEKSGHGLFYDELDKFNNEMIKFIKS